MNHPLQCRCGTVKGYVSHPGEASRMLCYCKDCQAYARFLGRADIMLDQLGGASIVATLPRDVHITQGREALTSMSLSDHGMLRWYARCCKTPIANTPRDVRTPYVGLIDLCLASESPTLADSFGPVRAVLNPKSAKGTVKATRLRNLLAVGRLMKSILPSRLDGSYRRNPFFTETGEPIARPHELTAAERERLA